MKSKLYRFGSVFGCPMSAPEKEVGPKSVNSDLVIKRRVVQNVNRMSENNISERQSERERVRESERESERDI